MLQALRQSMVIILTAQPQSSSITARGSIRVRYGTSHDIEPCPSHSLSSIIPALYAMRDSVPGRTSLETKCLREWAQVDTECLLSGTSIYWLHERPFFSWCRAFLHYELSGGSKYIHRLIVKIRWLHRHYVPGEYGITASLVALHTAQGQAGYYDENRTE